MECSQPGGATEKQVGFRASQDCHLSPSLSIPLGSGLASFRSPDHSQHLLALLPTPHNAVALAWALGPDRRQSYCPTGQLLAPICRTEGLNHTKRRAAACTAMDHLFQAGNGFCTPGHVLREKEIPPFQWGPDCLLCARVSGRPAIAPVTCCCRATQSQLRSKDVL